MSGELSWSRYAIICNLTAIVSLFFLMGFIPVFLVNFLCMVMISAGFLYLIDYNNGEITWFWDLGIVICINTMIWSLILRRVIRHSRRRGLNIVSYFLFAAALGCLSLEFISNLNRGILFQLTWSASVAAALIPAGGLMLFLHFLISSRIREKLKRKIHL